MNQATLTPHRLESGRPIRLADLATEGKQFHPDREAAEAEFRSLRDELSDWQERLYAEGRPKLLVVLQAMDAGGKDGTIRNVFKGVNPQGIQVTSFKVPSKEELAHDFLWRIHKAMPGNGMIGVFNRSHYEDVLVVRVHHLVPEAVWRPRYEQINHFEQLLAETGTTILKFYLHISREEQRQRFQARLDDPTKHWKFSFEDLEKRKLWDDYMAAIEEMLNQTTTPWAPWHVIPADQKWYRNLAVTRAIVQSLRDLNPQYPPPEKDLTGLIVE
ncbi:MAG: polyphosphate kinase 2 family protein [Chloroflexi bacterium]|nr:polyphosphate kinase 2 family protein [Chloroflexota bacterium]MCI0648493.1 polyphosphate kinase 2 family protein [Chloroflexota bacterium]MCI0726017.1 polyphosphate kinase 2 family protein [Chloroflexota bacterium]